MPEPQIEHYVPKSYLRRFTHDGEFLFVFDKFQKRCFESNIGNVACERYFYDFPNDAAIKMGLDPKLVEKELNDIEEAFSETVNSLLSKIIAKRKRRKII